MPNILWTVATTVTRFLTEKVLATGFSGPSKTAKSEFSRSQITVLHAYKARATAALITGALADAGFENVESEQLVAPKSEGDRPDWAKMVVEGAGAILVDEDLPKYVDGQFHKFSMLNRGHMCAVACRSDKPSSLELENHFNYSKLPASNQDYGFFCMELVARAGLSRLIHREQTRVAVTRRMVLFLLCCAIAVSAGSAFAGYCYGRMWQLESISRGQNFVDGFDAVEVSIVEEGVSTTRIFRTSGGDINSNPTTSRMDLKGHRLTFVDLEFLDVVTPRQHAAGAYCPKRGEHGSEAAYIESRRRRLFGHQGNVPESIWPRIQNWPVLVVDRRRDPPDSVVVVGSLRISGDAATQWGLISSDGARAPDMIGEDAWLLVRKGDVLTFNGEEVLRFHLLSRAVEERVCGVIDER